MACRIRVVVEMSINSARALPMRQRSDVGYEETGHRGFGFIFSSIRSAHFMLAR
jgi:hypothetical protein